MMHVLNTRISEAIKQSMYDDSMKTNTIESKKLVCVEFLLDRPWIWEHKTSMNIDGSSMNIDGGDSLWGCWGGGGGGMDGGEIAL